MNLHTTQYNTYNQIDRQNREAARFIERQEEPRTVNFRLSSNVNLSLPQTAVTYLFFAVISRIKERQKRDMLGGAVLKRRFTIYSYMMNIICFTLQNLELCRKKKTEAMRNFFLLFFFFLLQNLVLFKICPREFRARKLSKDFSTPHTYFLQLSY